MTFAWLLVITLMHIYYEKEQVGKKNPKLHSLRIKEASGQIILEPRFVIKEMRRLRRGLTLSGIKRVVLLKQDSTELSLPLVKSKAYSTTDQQIMQR